MIFAFLYNLSTTTYTKDGLLLRIAFYQKNQEQHTRVVCPHILKKLYWRVRQIKKIVLTNVSKQRHLVIETRGYVSCRRILVYVGVIPISLLVQYIRYMLFVFQYSRYSIRTTFYRISFAYRYTRVPPTQK